MAQKQKLKDIIGDITLILLFAALVATCAFVIYKLMTRWNVEGLG